MATNPKNKKKRIVSFYLHLPEEIFELLRDVSLARHLSRVATKSLGKDAKNRTEKKWAEDGIANVVTDLVEHHRPLLEDEAVKGGVMKLQKPASKASTRRNCVHSASGVKMSAPEAGSRPDDPAKSARRGESFFVSRGSIIRINRPKT